MKNKRLLVLGVFTAMCSLTIAGAADAQEKTAGRTLNIKLKYSGSGTVDDKHLIQVFVFDSPDFMSGGATPPLGIKASASKSGAVTFSGLEKSPVFVTSVYDPQGGYNDVTGPPPSGSSLGLYAKTPGTPEPVKIEPGETAEIEIAFDDSYKMP
jgi:hypothetical protein